MKMKQNTKKARDAAELCRAIKLLERLEALKRIRFSLCCSLSLFSYRFSFIQCQVDRACSVSLFFLCKCDVLIPPNKCHLIYISGAGCSMTIVLAYRYNHYLFHLYELAIILSEKRNTTTSQEHSFLIMETHSTHISL